MSTSETIQAHHLIRKAIIYIRQSTPQQVISHQESLRLQYALKQRALNLGWKDRDIEIIDVDLGLSGSSTSLRQGFKDMVSKVALGEVGIILSYEVTRFSRNCSDWYPLLDICGYSKCLIADSESVYDPGTPNGRLLLGLKGQLSELELYTLKNRMTAGLINKAKRGELALKLPVGLIRDEQGVVHKDPHQEVQSRLDLIFATFLRVGSANKVLRHLKEHHLDLPRQNYHGDLIWKKPTLTAILYVLKNPAYAGAFVYGRRKFVKQKADPRKKTSKYLPIDQWKVIVKDKYPAYISWEAFEKIQAKLKDNYAEYDRYRSRGIPRPGAAQLHGIVYCGKCGHKMVVQYKGGTRYLCNYLRQKYRAPVCQNIPADAADAKVIENFFEALSPLEIDAYEHTLNKIKQIEEQALLAQRQQIQRLEYQEQLAQRQYRKVDPDNRLVAAELEARWEQALRELHQAQQAFQQNKPRADQLKLPKDMVEAFKAISQHLPKIWQQPYLSSPTKKALLRCLIDKVVIHRSKTDTIQVRIVWKGGATTTNQIPVTVGSFTQLSFAQQMEEQIVQLAKQGIPDKQIAYRLTKQGYRSPTSKKVLRTTVTTIRLKHRILIDPSQSHSRRFENHLTVPQLAKKLEVKKHWFYDRINRQQIKISKDPKTQLYLFPDHPKTIEKLLELKTGKVKNVAFLINFSYS